MAGAENQAELTSVFPASSYHMPTTAPLAKWELAKPIFHHTAEWGCVVPSGEGRTTGTPGSVRLAAQLRIFMLSHTPSAARSWAEARLYPGSSGKLTWVE